MDQRMFKASCSGDVETLHQLLVENPFILSDYTLMDSKENPLVTATKSNQLDFIRELLTLKPDLVLLLGKDGFRPLDIASAYGNKEIVNEILESSWPEICSYHGKDGKTPIHYAAANGRVEIIDQLVSKNSDCVTDVTSFGETACHLAVKSFQFEVFERLLRWLVRVDMVELVNLGDCDGNSVLHCAVLRKQLESIQLLLDWNSTLGNNKLDINSTNKKGLTPSDIIEILTIESSTDVRIRQLLIHHGGTKSSELQIITENPKPETNQPTKGNNFTQEEKPKKWSEILKHFEYKWGRDSPQEARNILLLIVTLIATVTFEAGINPPSYLFEPANGNNIGVSGQYNNGTSFFNESTRSNLTQALNQVQRSGTERVNLASITIVLVANSIALSTAISIIDYLTRGLPFQRELRVSMGAMMFAYGWSLGNTKPTGLVKTVLLVISLMTPVLLRFIPYVVKKI